jgi:hypothetical protein
MTQTRPFPLLAPRSGYRPAREGTVKRARTTLIAAIAIGLLAGSAVGVTAQDEEVAAPEAAAFNLELMVGETLEWDLPLGGSSLTRPAAS